MKQGWVKGPNDYFDTNKAAGQVALLEAAEKKMQSNATSSKKNGAKREEQLRKLLADGGYVIAAGDTRTAEAHYANHLAIANGHGVDSSGKGRCPATVQREVDHKCAHPGCTVGSHKSLVDGDQTYNLCSKHHNRRSAPLVWIAKNEHWIDPLIKRNPKVAAFKARARMCGDRAELMAIKEDMVAPALAKSTGGGGQGDDESNGMPLVDEAASKSADEAMVDEPHDAELDFALGLSRFNEDEAEGLAACVFELGLVADPTPEVAEGETDVHTHTHEAVSFSEDAEVGDMPQPPALVRSLSEQVASEVNMAVVTRVVARRMLDMYDFTDDVASAVALLRLQAQGGEFG
jgi:hypothetical protein